MKETTIDQTLVLCDLDSLLLDAAGNLPQLQRDVLQLFASRGGRLTVFSQRSPRAVRSLLGGVRLSAPALVCGGTLAYNFSEGSGTALCSFEGMEESVLKMLPSRVRRGHCPADARWLHPCCADERGTGVPPSSRSGLPLC